jgi:protein-L-isoaspartate(D-aspartate) O-methyltransferase
VKSSRENGTLAAARRFYAQLLAANPAATNSRLEQAFETIPREAFLPPGPWQILVLPGEHYIETPTAEPIHLYQDVLVALDAEKGINNGSPRLHANWLAAVDPQPGEAVTHIGAGTGYYSALLSFLTAPGGTVTGYEIEEALAAAAARHLQPYSGVTILNRDATTEPLPSSDVIYVNAGVVAPPASWLDALKPGGRMIFPWRPAPHIALAILAMKRKHGIEVLPVGPAFFIPCIGASDIDAALRAPSPAEGAAVRSLWRRAERLPDASAVAIYPEGVVHFKTGQRPQRSASKTGRLTGEQHLRLKQVPAKRSGKAADP